MLGLKIDQDAWIVVGDGERALFLRNKGDAEFPNLEMIRVIENDNPPTSDQGTERPGRFSDGPSEHKSAAEPTDWHLLEKHRFAKELSETLYKAAHKAKFDKLVIVAPPMILGDLRKNLHSEVKTRIIAEVDKELTRHPVHKIEEILTART